MQNFKIGYVCWVLATSLIVSVVIGVDVVEASLNFTFFEEIREDDAGRLNQRDNYAVTVNFEQPLTDRIAFTEGVRYSEDWQEGGDSSSNVTTSILARLGSDLFFAALEGDFSSTKTADEPATDNNTVQFSWESLWKTKMIPHVTFSTSQDTYQAQGSTEGEVDRLSTNLALSWAYKYLSAYYAYGLEQTDNSIGAGARDLENQLASVQWSGSGWDNRVTAQLLHTFTFDKNDQVAEATDENVAELAVLISDVRMGLDDPTDTVELPSDNFLLRDGDLVTAVAPALPGGPSISDHTFLLAVNGQEVDVIYLYAVDTWGGGVPPDLNNWRLQSNDVLGTTWNDEVLDPLSISYDALNERLVIPVSSVQQNYIKVVVDRAISVSTIDFTEVEAYQLVDALAGTGVLSEYEAITNSTQLSIGVEITPNLNFRYSSSLRTEEYNSRADEKTNTNSFTLGYVPVSKSFTSTLDFTISSEEAGDTETIDRQSRSYGLSLSKEFLPTLEMGLSQSRSEAYESGEQQTLSDIYNFYGVAQIYPDLNSRFDASYTFGKSFTENPDSKTLAASFSVTSRVRPMVSISWFEGYTRNFYEDDEDAETLTSNLSYSFYVSKGFSINASYGITDDCSEDPVVQSASVSSNFAIGSSIQWSVRYDASKQFFLAQTVTSDLLWNIGKKVRARFGSSYIYSDEVDDVVDSESESENYMKVYAELSVNFGLPVK